MYGPPPTGAVNICWRGTPAAPNRSTAEDLTISRRPFTCLAIETATDLPGVALVRGGVVSQREAHGLRAPSRHVFEWVHDLLAEARLDLAELDCIAFGAGPGSFTGVRVAVAVAQALGYSRGIALCPVSSLAALAAVAVRKTGATRVACCLDAHMGEVYSGLYRGDDALGVIALGPDRLVPPGELGLPAEERWLAAGPGWAAYPDLTTRLAGSLAGIEPALLPSAVEVARLAEPLYRAGRVLPPAEAHPNYLRQRVATPAASTRIPP